jgi:hypothetical protein
MGACGGDTTADELSCREYAPCPIPAVEPCSEGNCCGPDEFCSRLPGDCEGPGVCEPRPEFCQEIFDPVCGCDGLTYSNPCEAARSNVSILHRGECQPLGPCTTNEDCGEGEYCLKDFGNCDGGGICELLPEACTFFFDPVCGCDGVTYDSICEATLARVAIADAGPCPGVPICGSDEECPDGTFCARSEQQCGEPGFCRAKITAAECAGEPDDPVCGCDERTYPNACLAAAAGVGVRGRHPCEVGVPCTGDEHCAGGTFCNRPQGLCDEPGTCTLAPDPRDCEFEPDDPVCGCDDRTYRNYCEALLAGGSVAYSGPCDDLPRCDGNGDCAEGFYCAFEESWCAGRSPCKPRPAECPADLVEPICGCDKQTYVNECVAAQNGISVAYRGPCGGEPGACARNADCGGGSLFCRKDVGDCEGAGECATLPEECTGDPDPACGCDGITYDSACLANQAGVNVLHPGPCAEER